MYLYLNTIIIWDIVLNPTFQIDRHVPFVFKAIMGIKYGNDVQNHSPKPKFIFVVHKTIPCKHCVQFYSHHPFDMHYMYLSTTETSTESFEQDLNQRPYFEHYRTSSDVSFLNVS